MAYRAMWASVAVQTTRPVPSGADAMAVAVYPEYGPYCCWPVIWLVLLSFEKAAVPLELSQSRRSVPSGFVVKDWAVQPV
jgi:hypothetical protein